MFYIINKFIPPTGFMETLRAIAIPNRITICVVEIGHRKTMGWKLVKMSPPTPNGAQAVVLAICVIAYRPQIKLRGEVPRNSKRNRHDRHNPNVRYVTSRTLCKKYQLRTFCYRFFSKILWVEYVIYVESFSLWHTTWLDHLS